MTTISVEEAGSRLKQLMELAIKGERVLITSTNGSSVELRPEAVSALAAGTSRKPGLLKGTFTVDPKFFEPLPEEELGQWG